MAEPPIKIEIEHAYELFYAAYFRRLQAKIKTLIPDAEMSQKYGRPAAYEVTINGKLVYSKLERGFFPKQHEIIRYCQTLVREGVEPEIVKPFDYILCTVM